MKILVTYDMFRKGFTELESKYEVTFPEGRDFTYEEVFEMIPEYDVLCSMLGAVQGTNQVTFNLNNTQLNEVGLHNRPLL